MPRGAAPAGLASAHCAPRLPRLPQDKHGLGTDVMTAADAMRKREVAKERREAAWEEEVKEAIAAESFDDLTDDEARAAISKEEL